ncbi:MAG: 3-deoxy-D-manno-octulosonic acid transferase, partial [Pontibacterium sp.]
HVYCPYDYPWAYRRFLKQFAPSACLLVETELWPNLIHTCNQRSVPVIVANARLSEKSAKGYGKFAWLTKPMLSGVTHIAAQDEDSAQRFIALGAAASTVSVMGSVKYDLEISDGLDAAGKALREVWGRDRKVVIAASTHEGEEAQVIKAFKALKSEYPTLLLVVVPRHPERFDHVAELLVEEGLNCVRRSQTSTSVRHLEKTVDVYLGDTMGELMTLYAASDIAIIGGSLIERGGHNPLESAALGKPTIIGESTYNFAEVCHTLQSAGGLAILSDNTHLSAEISKLLSGAGYAKNLGDAGAQVVANNKGALARLLKRVEPYLS